MVHGVALTDIFALGSNHHGQLNFPIEALEIIKRPFKNQLELPNLKRKEYLFKSRKNLFGVGALKKNILIFPMFYNSNLIYLQQFFILIGRELL